MPRSDPVNWSSVARPTAGGLGTTPSRLCRVRMRRVNSAQMISNCWPGRPCLPIATKFSQRCWSAPIWPISMPTSTAERQDTLSGCGWRGLLFKRRLCREPSGVRNFDGERLQECSPICRVSPGLGDAWLPAGRGTDWSSAGRIAQVCQCSQNTPSDLNRKAYISARSWRSHWNSPRHIHGSCFPKYRSWSGAVCQLKILNCCRTWEHSSL